MGPHMVMLRAAQLLEEDATALKDAHTLDGKWFIECAADESAKAAHDEQMAIAAKLRLMARL